MTSFNEHNSFIIIYSDYIPGVTKRTYLLSQLKTRQLNYKELSPQLKFYIAPRKLFNVDSWNMLQNIKFNFTLMYDLIFWKYDLVS